jgi:hypothetical protein
MTRRALLEDPKLPTPILLPETLYMELTVGQLSAQETTVRKTKGQIRIHSENLDKTSVSKPKKIFYSTDPDLKDLKGVLKELR